MARRTSQPGAVGPRRWPGDPSGTTALLPPPARSMKELAALTELGFERARTGAMTHAEAASLLAHGWTITAHLHLLRHDLGSLPYRSSRTKVTRGVERELHDAVSIDDDAFPPEWRLGSEGLADALRATPQSRFRLARAGGEVAGYAISGRARRDGYVQRLAVAPPHRGRGLGRALTVDGLRWLKRWRARSASVNTYEGNEAALRLYRSLGFEEVLPGLVVLTIDL